MENIMAILVTLCLMGAVTGVNPSGKLKDLQHEIFSRIPFGENATTLF
jgi:hypothetical protein